MIGISILWIPVVQAMQGGQLYIYIQAVSAYLAPPIATVYLMAVLWEGANEMVNFAKQLLYITSSTQCESLLTFCIYINLIDKKATLAP